VVFVIVLLVRGLSGRSADPPASTRKPVDTLRERYARGNIDREEFERIRRDIAE
jgi:putative membrane protein